MKTLSALVALISPWVAGASQTCTFPPSDSGVAPTDARLDRPFTCMPGSQDPTTKSTESTIDGPIPGHMYVDAKTTLYDMSPVASFIDGDDVKAAVIPRSTSTDALAAMLKQAQAEGAEIALLTEEDFGFGDAGESLSGPHITAVASTAKDLGMYVVCPFRMQLSPGESYNGAVVIGRNGTILRAANSGIDHYEKVFPVLGWPLGPLSQSSPGGDKEAFSVQQGEIPVIPGQHGVQVWDLPGIGRIAILICFDINYYELWHQAYALGAQVVFWPSMMTTPDRDAISLSRLFRYHVVANGSPGAIHDPTGHMVADLKSSTVTDSNGTAVGKIVVGTMRLDGLWVHENGPGAMICSGLTAMCKAHPGMFELAVGGCGGTTTCNATAAAPGEEISNNAVFLVRSLRPAELTVREAFTKFNVVAYRDYIFQNRQGLNSLRHAKADIPAPKQPEHAAEVVGVPERGKAGAQDTEDLTAVLMAEEERLEATIASLQLQLERVRSRLPSTAAHV